MSFSVNEIKTGYTKALSDYAADLTYEDIPEEVRERAKMIALQTIGVSLAANASPIARRAAWLGLQMNAGEHGAATAWLGGEKLSPSNAAVVNGTLADALDWEDCSWTGHPSASIIPVSWIMAESEKKSGKDFITAIVAAYEVSQRIAMAVQPPKDWDVFKGWAITSWQVFGATIAACKLLEMDSSQINQALGISAATSVIPSVLAHNTMSDLYHYEHGLRSRDGIQAALLTKAGITNARECFDDPYAYAFHMTEEENPQWYTKDLGKRYLIMDTLMKHWPANMWIQTPIELADRLITKYHITPKQVEEIIVDPPTAGRMTLCEDGYESMVLAQFSIPFVLASLICNHTPGGHWYAEENLKNPEVLALAKKIHGGGQKAHELMESFMLFRQGMHPHKTVTIRTKDGSTYAESMDCHLGHPNNMMSREQFVGRFRIQAGAALNEEKIENAIKVLCNIEEYGDLSELGSLFTIV